MMTCDTNRRAIVGAILAAGAVGATAVLPRPGSPDAECHAALKRETPDSMFSTALFFANLRLCS
jgi:hypothetical protein